MSKDALFIVIEGLDGSGKTTVARKLMEYLESLFGPVVKLTFEPNDASCGGLYIRQVLTKKIKQFSHKTLALSFAANRLDHGDRTIDPWLKQEGKRIVICDRYYLSSLVYQSNPDFPMEEVMKLNDQARQPDLIFFMNVSNEVCFQRMAIRNQPQELFEVNLSETRNKYYRAIEFLKKQTAANIIEIDGNGTIEQSLLQLTQAIYHHDPTWQNEALLQILEPNDHSKSSFSYSGSTDFTIDQFMAQFPSTSTVSKANVQSAFKKLDDEQIGALFMDFLYRMDYSIGSKLPLPQCDAFELHFMLPAGLHQRGSALFLQKAQQMNQILAHGSEFAQLSDFLFVFSPDLAEAETPFYEREIVQFLDKSSSLFPSVKVFTKSNLIDYLVEGEA